MSKNELLFAATILCILAQGCTPKRSAPAGPPNILLITVDTLRADRLGCYGYAAARTPNIDGLALEGVRVEHAIAPTPLTLPSHASILTGLEPPTHGIRGNGTFSLPDGAETLAERLRDAGFATQAFVSAEVLHHRFNLDQGFEGYDDEISSDAGRLNFLMPERSGQDTMDRVLEWLSSNAATEPSPKPFFLWVHLFDPHEPYSPPASDAQLTPTPYDGEIASVDRQIGRLVDALKAKGAWDHTIVAFTSDHGESLGEHGEGTHGIFIYESTVQVPLILRYPRKLRAGSVYRGPVRSIDIMPTVLAMAGLPSADTQGADLSKAFAGDAAAPKLLQYSESLHPELVFGMARLEGIRSDEWTYVRAPRPELYDRARDPGERRNLLEGEPSEEVTTRAAELDAQLTKAISAGDRYGLTAEPRELDEQTTEMLRALGYIEDSQTPERFEGIDPKDGVQLLSELNRAIALVQGNDCARAVEQLAAILERAPRNTRARNTLAQCQVRLGSLTAAENHYLRSIADDPRQPDVFLQIARIDFAQGDLESARARVSQTLELLPDSVDAMMLMGYFDLHQGDAASATRWYDRAIAADPSRPDAYVQQGDLYFRKGKFDTALTWYEKATARAPDNYAAAIQAGMCALRLGEMKKAEHHLLAAQKADPGRWQPAYGLACVRTSGGDASGAFALLREAARKGFSEPQRLLGDACLKPLASQPGFEELVDELRDAGGP